ncbi:MAG: hypothetical protein HY671_09500 [Chloroflexi bacterium]|nr:hypothetical protein [Chloroflexota bacterium]
MLVLIGAAAGVLGAVIGVWAMFLALGIGEYLGGRKSKTDIFTGKDSLKQRLLGLNSPELPYEIKPTSETDLLVEWKIVDAKWFAVFARERLSKIYRAFIVLDESRRAARYCEELVTVQWLAGTDGHPTPTLAYQRQFFRGRILFQKSWGVQYGLKENLKPGKIYEYKFDVGYVRDPIKQAVEDNGWEFVPVVRKSHATYQSLREV